VQGITGEGKDMTMQNEQKMDDLPYYSVESLSPPLSEIMDDEYILQYLVKKNLIMGLNDDKTSDIHSELSLRKQIQTKKLKNQLEGKAINPTELFIENQILKTKIDILQKSFVALTKAVHTLQQTVKNLQTTPGTLQGRESGTDLPGVLN